MYSGQALCKVTNILWSPNQLEMLDYIWKLSPFEQTKCRLPISVNHKQPVILKKRRYLDVMLNKPAFFKLIKQTEKRSSKIIIYK